jgi:glycine reductase
MSKPIRVAHFLNQFFAGIGGEEKAGLPMESYVGARGPGIAIQSRLGDSGSIVATIVAGDNWTAENPNAVSEYVRSVLLEYGPDIVIAGPAFNAGRYGLACGYVCAVASDLGIPAVSAMFEENPGVLDFDARAYILPTGESASEMSDVSEAIARFALKLTSGNEVGPAETEGYYPRGIRRPGLRDAPAAQRAVDLVVARLQGREWKTELTIMAPESVVPADPIEDLSNATVGLITTGGLVPKGNPDHLVRGGANEYLKYSIAGLDSLIASDWESVHRGFYTTTVNENPNYVLPLNIVRSFEQRRRIGQVHPWLYTTSGVGTTVAASKTIGAGIASDFKDEGVDCALLVAT